MANAYNVRKYIFLLMLALTLWVNSVFCQSAGEVDSLEKKITEIEKTIIQMRSEKQTSDILILVIGGIAALFATILAIKQTLDKKEGNKYFELLANQDKSSEKIFEWQKESNAELMNHVTKNIESSTRMVNSIGNIINLQKTAEEFKTTIENEKSRFKNRTLELNKKAIRIYQNIKRKDFYSTYFDNAVKDVHDNVMLLISSNPNETEVDYTSAITPSAYWLTGLHSFKTYQYADCRKWLDKTIIKCLDGLTDNERQGKDLQVIFPDENGILTQNGGREEWIKLILNQSYFIYGLIEINQGKYKEAQEKFSKAIEFRQHDYESDLLVIQSMYFSEEGNFESILNKLNSLKSIIGTNRVSEKPGDAYKNSIALKVDMLTGYFYFPVKNKSVKNPFTVSRDIIKSYKLFKEITDNIHTDDELTILPMIYYLTNISAIFTYSQILKELRDNSNSPLGPSKSEYTVKIKELHQKVILMGEIELQGIERDNLEMNFYLNYVISISYMELNMSNENNKYFSVMKSYLKKFENMQNFKIYSPFSKTFMSYQSIQEEITKLFTKNS